MGDDDSLRARDHWHAVVARQRVGDQRRGEVVLHGHRCAVHGVGIVRRPGALRDGELAVIGFLQAVRLHLPAGHQRIDAVRPAVAERRQVQLGRDVEIGRHLGVAAEPGGIAARHQDHRGGAGFDGAQRVPQHVHGGGAAVGVLDEPAQRQAKLPGEIDGGVRRERERGDRHPVDLARVDRGVHERGDDCVANEGMRRLSRLRPARIGRLSYADDGGIRVHDFARQRVERDGSGC